jgi:hypothetical protein
VVSLLNEVGQHGTLDLVAYNVGNNAMIPTLEITEAQFETMWRQKRWAVSWSGARPCAACCRREAAPFSIPEPLHPCVHGLLLLLLPPPRPPCVPSPRGLAREFGPQGIHVAHVVVDGVIGGDYARSRFPDFVAAKGKDGLLAPDDIADAYWALHRQPRSAWTHERPFREPF